MSHVEQILGRNTTNINIYLIDLLLSDLTQFI